jgi:hypothetical protein
VHGPVELERVKVEQERVEQLLPRCGLHVLLPLAQSSEVLTGGSRNARTAAMNGAMLHLSPRISSTRTARRRSLLSRCVLVSA